LFYARQILLKLTLTIHRKDTKITQGK